MFLGRRDTSSSSSRWMELPMPAARHIWKGFLDSTRRRTPRRSRCGIRPLLIRISARRRPCSWGTPPPPGGARPPLVPLRQDRPHRHEVKSVRAFALIPIRPIFFSFVSFFLCSFSFFLCFFFWYNFYFNFFGSFSQFPFSFHPFLGEFFFTRRTNAKTVLDINY